MIAASALVALAIEHRARIPRTPVAQAPQRAAGGPVARRNRPVGTAPNPTRILASAPASPRVSHGLNRPRPTEGEWKISVLRNLEQRLENLVEGVFSRTFSSQVQPVEIARKLAKEMDAHKTTSISRIYVPNQYTVWMSEEDRTRFEGYERSLGQELSAYLLEHARRHDYALLTRPEVNLETDDRLRLGEFGIQTRMVKPPQRQGEAAVAGRAGPHDGLLGAAEAAAEAPRGADAAA